MSRELSLKGQGPGIRQEESRTTLVVPGREHSISKSMEVESCVAHLGNYPASSIIKAWLRCR